MWRVSNLEGLTFGGFEFLGFAIWRFCNLEGLQCGGFQIWRV